MTRPPLAQRLAPYRKALIAAVANLAAVGLAVLGQTDPDAVPALASQIAALGLAVLGTPAAVYAMRNATQPQQTLTPADLERLAEPILYPSTLQTLDLATPHAERIADAAERIADAFDRTLP